MMRAVMSTARARPSSTTNTSELPERRAMARLGTVT